MSKMCVRSERLRVVVSKSNTAVYCSLVDDKNHKVLMSVSSRDIDKTHKNCNKEKARKTGELFGDKMLKLNIKTLMFDRNDFLYHGKVMFLAEGIRSKGFIF